MHNVETYARSTLIRRLEKTPQDLVQDVLLHLRGYIASKLGPHTFPPHEACALIRPYVEEMLTLLRASLSVFGRTGWLLGWYHDAHWDLYRALSDEDMRKCDPLQDELHLRPLDECKLALGPAASRLIARLESAAAEHPDVFIWPSPSIPEILSVRRPLEGIGVKYALADPAQTCLVESLHCILSAGRRMARR